uniref:Uncharacterized protein n=1 Tax=Anopheles culicifacies TaxID=139723 RepID=A0A182M3U1_9DIPT
MGKENPIPTSDTSHRYEPPDACKAALALVFYCFPFDTEVEECFKKFAHYKEEMYLQAQRVFNVSADRHYRLLHAATEEKPKIIVLTVIVQEAEGLEAKDANAQSAFGRLQSVRSYSVVL